MADGSLRNTASEEALLFLECHAFDLATEPVPDFAHSSDRVKFLFSFLRQRTPPTGCGSQGPDSLPGH